MRGLHLPQPSFGVEWDGWKSFLLQPRRVRQPHRVVRRVVVRRQRRLLIQQSIALQEPTRQWVKIPVAQVKEPVLAVALLAIERLPFARYGVAGKRAAPWGVVHGARGTALHRNTQRGQVIAHLPPHEVLRSTAPPTGCRLSLPAGTPLHAAR